MMAARSEYRVTNPKAMRDAITPGTRRASEELASIARQNSPSDTGRLRGGWRVVPGKAPGAFIVVNDVAYGKYVEHGTKHIRGFHMLGIAAAQIRGRYGSR